MKTDELISMLANGVQPIDRHLPAKLFAMAVSSGLLIAVALVVFFFGVRTDIAQAVSTLAFWAKVLVPLCVLLGCMLMLNRLARPGMDSGAGGVWIIVVLLVVWAGTIYVLADAEPGTRSMLVFGSTWRTCALNIALLSIPGFIAAFWALRVLAPTRPRLAGGCCGMLAGAMGCLAYCLHCPEIALPFWAVWYVLGMLLPAVIGALVGPRLLSW